MRWTPGADGRRRSRCCRRGSRPAPPSTSTAAASFTVRDGVVWFANFDDQRVYRLEPGDEPVAVTPSGARYADLAVSPDGDAGGGGAGAPPRLGRGRQRPRPPARTQVVAEGHDFYAAPRWSPDGHAGLAVVGPPQHAVGRHRAVGRRRAGGGRARRVDLPAPVGARRQPAVGVRPHRLVEPLPRRPASWSRRRPSTAARTGSSGCRRTPSSPTARVAAVRATDGLGQLTVARGRRRRHAVHLVLVGAGLRRRVGRGRGRVGHGGAGRRRASTWRTAAVDVIRRSREDAVDPGYLSQPRPITFPTDGGLEAHALFYPPANADFEAPAGELPPLVVMSHGGPDGQRPLRAQPVHPVLHQPGPGRGRRRLRGQLRLRPGLPAPARRPVGRRRRGRLRQRRPPPGRARAWSTAGAWPSGAGARAASPPCAPSPSPTSSPPGPATTAWPTWPRWPPTPTSSSPATSTAWSDRGRRRPTSTAARSPIHAADRLSAPVIVFQGLEDKVVPPAQAEVMVDALAGQGPPVRLRHLRGRAARLPPGGHHRAGGRGRAVLLRPDPRLRARRRHRTGPHLNR